MPSARLNDLKGAAFVYYSLPECFYCSTTDQVLVVLPLDFEESQPAAGRGDQKAREEAIPSSTKSRAFPASMEHFDLVLSTEGIACSSCSS